MRCVVTGGAGFIGSHLVDKLLSQKYEVTVYDNFSTGRIENIANKNVIIKKADILDTAKLKKVLKDQDIVYHLAANPDIRASINRPKIHFNDVIGTYNVLESMRLNDIPEVVFTSSSVVYGESTVTPTPETYGPLVPISMYGSSKLASEGLITAYCETFGFKCWIFRLANVIGSRCTHGILVDFIEKVKNNPRELEILGDGSQKKSYIYITDCIKGMMWATKHSNKTVNLFNIGSPDYIEVKTIVEIFVKKLRLKNIKLRYTGGRRGWTGDIPIFLLSIDKLRGLGWKPRYTSEQAVRKTIDVLVKELGLAKKRK